jgi:uncharacterized protein
MRTGIAETPLHGGKAPAWLFSRMVSLSREIIRAIVEEYGPDEVLLRLSSPYWFQAFGCVIGFDWHSSGITTTTLGALKEALKDLSAELDLYVAGGKGGVSRKTPDEIRKRCERIGLDPEPLVYASRMSAKVDSAVLQDGYQIYAHSFLFSGKGNWVVVQQGMNESERYARRYHWLGRKVSSFVVEPHAGIISGKTSGVLDLTAGKSGEVRDRSVEIIRQPVKQVMADLREVVRISRQMEKSVQGDLFDSASPNIAGEGVQTFRMPSRHWVSFRDIRPDRLRAVLLSTYERRPDRYESLVGLEGVGAKTLRALALMSEVIYGAEPSFEDPARFSYAVGGKDGAPYPVNRPVYDESIQLLKHAIDKAKIGQSDRKETIQRLMSHFHKESEVL